VQKEQYNSFFKNIMTIKSFFFSRKIIKLVEPKRSISSTGTKTFSKFRHLNFFGIVYKIKINYQNQVISNYNVQYRFPIPILSIPPIIIRSIFLANFAKPIFFVFNFLCAKDQ
jgi:hypothetical protein